MASCAAALLRCSSELHGNRQMQRLCTRTRSHRLWCPQQVDRMPRAAQAIGCLRPPAEIASGRAADIEHKAVRSLTPTPRAPYLRPSERHPPEAAPEIPAAKSSSRRATSNSTCSGRRTARPSPRPNPGASPNGKRRPRRGGGAPRARTPALFSCRLLAFIFC